MGNRSAMHCHGSYARHFLGGLIGLIAALFLSGSAFAASLTPSEAELVAKLNAAWHAAVPFMIRGPAVVPLRGEADLNLPEGYYFVPTAPALRIMRASGNPANNASFIGLIGDEVPANDWAVAIDFQKDGYVRDDDAKHWDADGLLNSLREGTAARNKERAARGIPELEIEGWIEKPAYDPATHRLVWSIATKEKFASDNPYNGVNYNTYTLGRDGYFGFNLVTNRTSIETYKSVTTTLLDNLHYRKGRRYEDFNAGTDHVAEYGLAALIGVVAAKKLGFLALAGLAFAKFAKLIIAALAAFLVAAKKIFGRRKSALPPPLPPGAR